MNTMCSHEQADLKRDSARPRRRAHRLARALLAIAALAVCVVPASPGAALAASPNGEVAVGEAAATTQSTTGTTGTQTQTGPTGTTPAKPIASATLQQCATATSPQTERSATFAGEMTAITGTAKMTMRIDLQEWNPEELAYRTIVANGLGVWQHSDPGVKVFAHIQQVTNLSAPALYRGLVRFRWLNAKGRVIKSEELHTVHCEQPLSPSSSNGSSTTSTTPSSSTTSGSTGSTTGGGTSAAS
jgi:hypothetical protein